jgi:lipopolysaccharide export system protein LptC
MTASASFDSGRHTWQASARTDMRAAFRRARRHSRFVRVLRVLIPGGIAAFVFLSVFGSWLNPFSALASLPGVGKLSISGTRVTMDLPRLAGYTRDGRSYELTAAAAAQDLKRPQFIELQEIRAKVELQDHSVVNITAATGVYDTKGEAVVLKENVLVSTSDGTEIRLAEAIVDMRKGHVVSNKPVDVLMPTGRIQSEALEVVDDGAVIYFKGGVRMDMNQQSSSQTKRTEAMR